MTSIINKRALLNLLILSPFMASCMGDSAAVLINKTMPDLALKTLDGNIINLAKMNKPMIIRFFGLWCMPCLRDAEFWDDAVKNLKKYKDLEILMVHVNPVPAQFISLENWHNTQKEDVRTPIIYDENAEIFNQLKIPGTPSTLIISKDGHILEHYWAFQSKNGEKAFLRKAISILKLE